MRAIIRVEHNKNKPYVQISRKILEDRLLDLQSKGMLCFLLSKPDNWRIRPVMLAKELRESRATVYRILNKLIASKYVHREVIRRRKRDGQFQTAALYVVFEDKGIRQEWVDLGRFHYEKATASQI